MGTISEANAKKRMKFYWVQSKGLMGYEVTVPNKFCYHNATTSTKPHQNCHFQSFLGLNLLLILTLTPLTLTLTICRHNILYLLLNCEKGY